MMYRNGNTKGKNVQWEDWQQHRGIASYPLSGSNEGGKATCQPEDGRDMPVEGF